MWTQSSLFTCSILNAFSSTYLNFQRNIWDGPVICRHVLRENFWIFKEGQDVPSRTQIRIHFVLLFWILTLEYYPVYCLLMLPSSLLNNLLVILPCKIVCREVWKSYAHSAIGHSMPFWGNMSWIRNKEPWSCDLWAGQSVLRNLSRTTNTHRSGVSKVLLRGGSGIRKLGVGWVGIFPQWCW